MKSSSWFTGTDEPIPGVDVPLPAVRPAPIASDSLAVMKLAARLRSVAAALVAHGASPMSLTPLLDDFERDFPVLLAAVRGEVQP